MTKTEVGVCVVLMLIIVICAWCAYDVDQSRIAPKSPYVVDSFVLNKHSYLVVNAKHAYNMTIHNPDCKCQDVHIHADVSNVWIYKARTLKIDSTGTYNDTVR